MNPPRLIETRRLVLRVPGLHDAGQVFEAYAQDRDVTRYLTWRPAQVVAETEAAMRQLVAEWDRGESFSLVITRKDDGRLIGMVAMRPEGFRVNLGYVLARPYWGQGYMTEAVSAVVEWALAQAGVFRVWAVCDVEHAASARVLEKVGMQKEGTLRRWGRHPNVSDEPRDCLCYAIVK